MVISLDYTDLRELAFKQHKGRPGKRGGSLPKASGLHVSQHDKEIGIAASAGFATGALNPETKQALIDMGIKSERIFTRKSVNRMPYVR